MITKMEIQDEEWNLVHIELSNFKGVSKLSVYGVYRPPKKTRLNSYSRRIEEFLGGTSGEVILVGDMNVDLNKTHDRDVKMYIDTMTSLGLTVYNNNVTRESSNAVLDHVYTNMESTRKIHTATIKCDFSDHNVLMSSFQTRIIAKEDGLSINRIDY